MAVRSSDAIVASIHPRHRSSRMAREHMKIQSRYRPDARDLYARSRLILDDVPARRAMWEARQPKVVAR